MIAICFALAVAVLIGSVSFVKELLSALPLPNVGNALPKVDTVAVGSVTSGQDIAIELVKRVINAGKLILEALCVGYIIFVGIEFIVNLSNEEILKKKQNQLLYGLVGFVMLNIGDMAIALFAVPNTGGEILNATAIPGWLNFVNLLLNIIKYSIGTVAVIILILTGYKMVSAQEKDIAKEKKLILWVAVGLMFVLVAHLIQQVFIPLDTVGFETINEEVGSQQSFDVASTRANTLILNVAKLILFVMGPIAFFFLILAGVYLITANGDAARIKRAKNIFIGTIIAVVMSYSAYALVSEVIRNLAL